MKNETVQAATIKAQQDGSQANVQALLDLLTHEDISRVYSGAAGCGCGCRGNYSETKGQKTRILNLMRERVADVRVQDGVLVLEDEAGVLSQAGRYRWAYLAACQ